VADFAEQLRLRMAAGEPAWFPGLAEALVRRFWTTETRIDSRTYRTAAWLGEPDDGSAKRVPGQASMSVESLPPSLGDRFAAGGFAEDVPAMAQAVAAALTRLGGAGPGDSVSQLVRSVHRVRAPGAGYDFSHSEPGIPFSVLLSNPAGERHADLRLAESLLHEAMHLQLTLIEREASMVGVLPGTGYSPWQGRERPVQGLLHGLYVFTAIDQWLRLVGADTSPDREGSLYVERRLAEIGAEVREVANLATSPALTALGRDLVEYLLAEFGCRAAPSL